MKKKIIITLLVLIAAAACAVPYFKKARSGNDITATSEVSAETEDASEENTEDASDSDTENLTDTEKFIEQYEDLNLQSYVHGDKRQLFRAVALNHDADIKYISYKEAIEKLNNGDNFVLYYGWPDCPYCRSMIEPLLNASVSAQMPLYVIELPDDSYKTSRTNYEWKDGEVVISNSNADYDEFIEAFGGLDTFREFVVYKDDDDSEGVLTGKAGMYAPTILLVKDGNAILYSEDEWEALSADQEDTEKEEKELHLENAFKSVAE